jgi:SAM-dependent methyltransferase
MTFHDPVRRWRVPLIGQAPSEVPDEWGAALAAVALDLRCRRQGRVICFDGVQWELAVNSQDWVSIGMAKLTDASDLGEFSIGRGYALKTTLTQAMVWVASAVQDQLAGYEFVQWPSDGWRLLDPTVRNNEPVWVDPSTGSVVSPIGALRDLAEAPEPCGGPVRYDRTGRSYSRTRRADRRVAAVIADALRGMATVANIGAGTGSYEPAGTVIAVEPSRVMITQRPPSSAPAVQAIAEHLPIRSNSVDAALAVLTVHHWSDLDRGVAEMLRIARRRVVILTWDHNIFRQFWLLREYLPAAGQSDAELAVPITKLTSLLGEPTIVPIPVPHDCADGFGGAYWRRPEAYLDPTVQSGMSLFALTPKPELQEGLYRLRTDLASGAWERQHQELVNKQELDLGYRLLIVEQ